jgi:LuxR family transcriptional regulator, maltose regulon positive regulatory protein
VRPPLDRLALRSGRYARWPGVRPTGQRLQRATTILLVATPAGSGASSVLYVNRKFGAPAISEEVVERPRIVSRLSSRQRVALVVAPPGYGKTVAARQWVDETDEPAAWFSVDFLDENPESFWVHFLKAVRTVIPEMEEEPEFVLAERGAANPLFLAVLIAQLVDQPRRATIVLDDFARINDRLVLEGVALLVERVGDKLGFVLTGRSDPRLPLSRWRLNGWVVDIREDELRLTDNEALAMARTFGELGLSEESVTALNTRVYGWPIALHLALVSLRDDPHPQLAARTLAGSERLLADYLVSEVLERLPERQRDVALRLSVLDWFDLGLCRDLIGPEAPGLALDLLRYRLFVASADDPPGVMRYHALFRLLLQQELRFRDPTGYDRLHRRAAELWAERGELHAAYRHLVTVGDHQAASDLVLGPVYSLVSKGDHAGIARIVNAMPRSVQMNDPGLALDLAAAWHNTSRRDNVETWCQRAEKLGHDAPPVALRLHTLRCLIALMTGDLATAAGRIAAHEALVEQTGAVDPLEGLMDTLRPRVMLAFGNVGQARYWLRRAKSPRGPDYVLTVIVPALEAWLELIQGHLAGATRLALAACGWAESHDLRPHHGALDALVTAAWCHIGAGEFAAAEEMVESARLDADLLGWSWDLFRAGLVAAELGRLRLGPVPALNLVSDLRQSLAAQLPATQPDSYFAAQLDEAEATALVAMSRVDRARALVDRISDGPRRRLLLAQLLRPGSSPDEVATLLARRNSWPLPLRLEAEVVLGAKEPSAASAERLSSALAEGAESGWVSPFLGHADPIEQQLRRLPVRQLHPLLAAAWDAQMTNKPVPKTGNRPNLTDRERSVLELLPTHLSYAQIGKELYLSVNTVKSALKVLYRKLDAGTRNEAVDMARAAGLI